MEENHLQAEDLQHKVIPIHMDANFFFERAVRSLDRLHYDKALKYFRKAVEYEPENPVNHCNMAGILSEMGDYEGSNAVLADILEHVDASMTECYFYMANNYANMENFEEAEQVLIKYLEEDPAGQFLDEAEEMMELFQYELERPVKLNRIRSREGMVEHEDARALMEEGKFSQAAELLEQIVQEHPDFLAARNNLALAYYYMGLFHKAKTTIGEVLELEQGNIHGLCNLAIFYQHEGDTTSLNPLLELLEITVPFHQEHVFKLATTMGILGRHESAYGHFRRLLKDEEVNGDPSLYHYTAVAAFNSGRYKEAERYWRQVKKLDPASDIPRFYLTQLEELDLSGAQRLELSYHYHLPFEEQLKRWEQDETELCEEIKINPLIRSSFFWALRYGDKGTKLQVIRALGWIADEEVKETLEAFLKEPDEPAELKDEALRVLQEMGVGGSAQAILEVSASSASIIAETQAAYEYHGGDSFQAVVDQALKHMGAKADREQKNHLQNLWAQFLGKLHPDTPMIRQTEGWSAALEYLTAKQHGSPLTYQEVAQRYGVSVSTVSRYVKRIDSVCSLKDEKDDIFRPFTENI
ncbi:tetratricopeptide repeat protein [Paenibacillus dokdonensis]|uniref:Tetratricopeptide repeat protein n=1 Tax=Paenibacillus dokdonensis TaxID=2567944 RepID=A0ABU6GSY1_9BACL|nr:tetratricopeptide repeat protein [Paenibacillus dokdonensis]MEC0241391.1 tetratricopeptide repeat protein [Paenibacillus dokdonensis]